MANEDKDFFPSYLEEVVARIRIDNGAEIYYVPIDAALWDKAKKTALCLSKDIKHYDHVERTINILSIFYQDAEHIPEIALAAAEATFKKSDE